jgi:hypothetical protein
MRLTMVVGADRRRHVDDSLDQFGLVDLAHGIIAAFELHPRQPVALDQPASTLARRGTTLSNCFDRHGTPP